MRSGSPLRPEKKRKSITVPGRWFATEGVLKADIYDPALKFSHGLSLAEADGSF
jgi:hypothetical protein